MKTLGIVGGIGPESTVDYDRSLIRIWRERTMDGSVPSILVNSIDLKKMLDLIAANKLSDVTAYLSGEIERLAPMSDCLRQILPTLFLTSFNADRPSL